MARKKDDPTETTEDQDDKQEPEGGDVTSEVNRVMTGRLRKFQQDLLGRVKSEVGDLIKAHTEELAKQAEERETAKSEPVAPDDESEKRLAQLEARYEKRIRDLEAKAEKERQEREQERQARLEQEERQALADELRKRGVPPESVDLGVAYYWTHTKRVGRDETGKLVWLTGDDLDPHKPLTEGVEEALGTDLGKRLLPPIPAGGSGARASSVRSERGKDLSDSDLGGMLADSSS